MSLNNIQLQPHTVAELYADALLETAPAAPAQSAPAPPRRSLGNNEKSIAVLVDHPNAPILPDPELAFLTSVLSACRLTLADITVVNIHGAEPGPLLADLQTRARSFLLFGIAPLDLGLPIHFPAFQLQAFDGRMYLQAPPLSELEKDKALKLQLWNCLKTLFGI